MIAKKQTDKNVIAMGTGLALQAVGAVLAMGSADSRETGGVCFGAVLFLVGSGVFLWGCMSYAEGKGYNKKIGWLGMLSFFGLIVLACLPSKQGEPETTDPIFGFPAIDRLALGIIGILIVAGLCLAVMGSSRLLLATDTFKDSPPSDSPSSSVAVYRNGKFVRFATRSEAEGYHKDGQRRPTASDKVFEPSRGIGTPIMIAVVIAAIYFSQHGFWLFFSALRPKPTKQFYEKRFLLPWRKRKD